MFERFTDRARKVLALANQEAQRLNHEYIGTEHILLGMLKEGSGVGANVLRNRDVDLRRVRIEVEKLLKSGPEIVKIPKLAQTPRAKEVIRYSIEEARSLGHTYVGTEHLLLGLLRESDGLAGQVLINLDLDIAAVREEVLNLLGASLQSEAVNKKGSPAYSEAEKPSDDDSLIQWYPIIKDSYDRFTDCARRVLALAIQEARDFHHEYIGTEHLLLGLLSVQTGVGARVLKRFDVDLRKAWIEVEKLIGRGPEIVTPGDSSLTLRAKNALEYAMHEALRLNHDYVGTEHLLLGLLHEPDGVAGQALINLKVDVAEVGKDVRRPQGRDA